MSAMSGCVVAHGESERPPALPGDTCSVATHMRDQALDNAFADAPFCKSDSDCVVLSTAIRCDSVLNLTDCGFVVHREVAERYAQEHVQDRVCGAVKSAEYGCQLQPLCIGQGAPSCVAGECMAGDLER
jgi:hypothetical protein